MPQHEEARATTLAALPRHMSRRSLWLVCAVVAAAWSTLPPRRWCGAKGLWAGAWRLAVVAGRYVVVVRVALGWVLASVLIGLFLVSGVGWCVVVVVVVALVSE